MNFELHEFSHSPKTCISRPYCIGKVCKRTITWTDFKCVSTNELVSHVARFRKCHFSVRKRHLWHALFVESKYLLLKSVHSSMFCSCHFWFMLFGLFWRQSYVNITLYLITFCKARWARQKKRKENHTTKVIKIPKTKRRKYRMNKT